LLQIIGPTRLSDGLKSALPRREKAFAEKCCKRSKCDDDHTSASSAIVCRPEENKKAITRAAEHH